MPVLHRQVEADRTDDAHLLLLERRLDHLESLLADVGNQSVKDGTGNMRGRLDAEDVDGRVEGHKRRGKSWDDLRVDFALCDERVEEGLALGVDLTEEEEHLVVTGGDLAFEDRDELTDENSSAFVDVW